MNLYKSFNLYKENIYRNRFIIFVSILILALCILLEIFIDIQGYGINISELQLAYNSLDLYKQWLYILICILIILRMISFAEDYLYVLRVGIKDKLWNLITQNILITNFIISAYLVMFSYICGLIFSNQNYMEFNKTLILIIGIIFIYTIGISLFSFITIIIDTITGSKTIAYLLLMCIIIIEYLRQQDSLILYHIGFNMEYLENISLLFFNIFKFGGILILIIEFGRFIYKRKEIYNTKKRIINEI
ncbi:MAG: hypothetical protein RSD36_16770 [Terrisporobacter sp.]